MCRVSRLGCIGPARCNQSRCRSCRPHRCRESLPASRKIGCKRRSSKAQKYIHSSSCPCRVFRSAHRRSANRRPPHCSLRSCIRYRPYLGRARRAARADRIGPVRRIPRPYKRSRLHRCRESLPASRKTGCKRRSSKAQKNIHSSSCPCRVFRSACRHTRRRRRKPLGVRAPMQEVRTPHGCGTV